MRRPVPMRAAALLALLALSTSASAQFLDRSDWAAFATSVQDSESESAPAANTFDGDNSTWWLTQVRASALLRAGRPARRVCRIRRCADHVHTCVKHE